MIKVRNNLLFFGNYEIYIIYIQVLLEYEDAHILHKQNHYKQIQIIYILQTQMNNSATFNKLNNNPETYAKMKRSKYKQRKHENIKYKSLIFLSQKFQGQGLLKNKFDKEEVNRSRSRKMQRDNCKSRNNDVKHDDMQLIFEDKDIAQKIRTLRKPTYSSNTTIMQIISNEIQNRTSTNFSTLSKSSKKHKQNQQRMKLLKKQAQHLWQPVPKLSPNKIKQQNNMIFAEKVKKFMSTSYDQSIINKKQRNKTDRTIYTEEQTQPDRNQNGNQVIKDCGKIYYSQHNKDQGGQNQKEGRNQMKKYDRWAAKSSMEWIGQDCGNEDTVGVRERKDRKIRSKVMNEITVPKSSLYMSMYLRIRDKQQQTNSPNKKLLKTNQSSNNEMQISKIQKLPQNPVHPIKYLHRRMQNNKKFNNYSYHSISSKFRQKREQNRNKMSMENQEKVMMRIMDVREEYGQLYKLKVKNSRKESGNWMGKGPTITIDPW